MSYEQITFPRLQELLDDSESQLVEVLPPEEYEELHLPRAISIPLKTLDHHSTAGLDRSKAVVVYCWDALCDMSPRAASRLVLLGFEHVFDYMPSKVDWMARGLPMEGTKAQEARAIDVALQDVVTCRLDEPISEVRQRVEASPYGFGFVTTQDGVLLGRLRQSALQSETGTAGEVMEPGPSTTRPDVSPGKLAKRLQDGDLTSAVLSDPEGRLLGIVRRTDLEAA